MSVASDDDLFDEFDAEAALGDAPPPSWNVAPTDPVRIVVDKRVDSGEPGSARRRQLATAHWGLVPSWSRDLQGAARMINCRIETITTKPAFRSAAARRRCLVPAAGYYEWQQQARSRVPHYLFDDSAPILGFAGLYEFWRDPRRADDDPQRWLCTCTIVTQEATDAMGEIHDRTPVVVPAELRDAWLNCTDDDPAAASLLLAQIPPLHLVSRVVANDVGNVRNNGAHLIAPLDEAPSQPQSLF